MTDTILLHIEAEWIDFPNPLIAFIASQPAEIQTKIHSMIPNQISEIEGESSNQTFMLQQLQSYADNNNRGKVEEKENNKKRKQNKFSTEGNGNGKSDEVIDKEVEQEVYEDEVESTEIPIKKRTKRENLFNTEL